MRVADFLFLEETCRFLENVKRDAFRQFGPKSIVDKQNNKRKRSRRGRGRGRGRRNKRGRGRNGRGGKNDTQNQQEGTQHSSSDDHWNPLSTRNSLSGGQYFDQNRRQNRGRGRGRGRRGGNDRNGERHGHSYENYNDFIPLDHRPRIGDQKDLFQRSNAKTSTNSSESQPPPKSNDSNASVSTSSKMPTNPPKNRRSAPSTSQSSSSHLFPSNSSNMAISSHPQQNFSQNSFPSTQNPTFGARAFPPPHGRPQPPLPQMMPNGPPLPHMGPMNMNGFQPQMNNQYAPNGGFAPPQFNNASAAPPQGFAPAGRTPIFGFPFQQQNRGGFDGPRW